MKELVDILNIIDYKEQFVLSSVSFDDMIVSYRSLTQWFIDGEEGMIEITILADDKDIFCENETVETLLESYILDISLFEMPRRRKYLYRNHKNNKPDENY